MQRKQFRPSFWLTLFLGSVFAMTASFGFWQLDRADQKRTLQAAIDSRSVLPPISLPNTSVDTSNLDSVQHYTGSVQGVWLPEQQFLLENVVHEGKNGFYVYTPLLMGDGQVVVVNRGWVAASPYRDQLPDVPVADANMSNTDGVVRVAGRFAAPRSKPVMVGGLPAANINSQVVWFYLDLELVSKQVAKPVAHFVMLQNSDDESGLVREWPIFDTKVDMHIGYAIQWFAFAFIALVFFLIFSFRRPKAEEK